MARNKIKELLDERGMSVYRLVKLTGMSPTQIYDLANQEEIPPGTTWSTLKKIRDALGLECVDQLEENERGP